MWHRGLAVRKVRSKLRQEGVILFFFQNCNIFNEGQSIAFHAFYTLSPLLWINFLLYNSPPPTPFASYLFCHGLTISIIGTSREYWNGWTWKPKVAQTAVLVAGRARWWDMNMKGKERTVWDDLLLHTSHPAVRLVLSSDVSLGVGVWGWSRPHSRVCKGENKTHMR